MKKWFSKIKLILAMTMMVGLLTGCNAGSTIETKLTINNDLSGSRVMELVINQSVYDEYFTGTTEELNAALAETCPAQLVWAYDDSTGTKVYKFTLDFTSPEDYKAKVDALLGEGSDVSIEITQADSVWASGVLVNEGFSSGQILEWLKTMLVEKGFVESSNSSKIFQEGGNTIYYRGAEYTDSGSIYIDKIEYLDIDKIELLSDVNGYDSYNKSIVLTIPKYAMDKKGDEIKAWLAERVPEGAAAEWSENTESSTSIYTVSKKDMSGADLETFLKAYFDSEECFVEQNKVTENVSPFAFRNELKETIDFSNYVVGSRMNYTDIYSYVIGNNGYGAGRRLTDLSDGTVTEDNDSDDYPGYKRTNINYLENSLRQLESISQKVYKVSEVNVESNIGLFGGLSREYTFILDGEPTDAEKEEILAKINDRGAIYTKLKEADKEESTKDETEDDVDSTEIESTEVVPEEAETEAETENKEAGEPDWKVKVSGKTDDGDYVVVIKQEGDAKELEYSSTALFGSAVSFQVTKNFGFAALSYPVAIHDGYTLGNFVEYCTENVDATYTLNAGFGSSMEYASLDDADVEGSKVIIEDSSVIHGVTITVYGSQFNMWALMFYLLLIGGVVCIVLSLKKAGAFDNLLAKLPVKATKPQVEKNEVQKFCRACGAPRQKGAKVCTQCGTKFDN